jgi:hypothetical protein
MMGGTLTQSGMGPELGRRVPRRGSTDSSSPHVHHCLKTATHVTVVERRAPLIVIVPCMSNSRAGRSVAPGHERLHRILW